MNKFRVSIIAVMTMAMVGILYGEGLTGDKVLEKVDSYRNFSDNGFSFDFVVSEVQGNDTLKSTMRVYVKGTLKALCKYIKPEGMKGKFVLMDRDSFWFFQLGMNAPTRISPRQMLMGQASSGDITRIIFSRIYSIESFSKTGRQYVLKLRAIPGRGATYEKMVLYVKKSNYQPVLARCYSRTGILLKTIYYTKFDIVQGRKLLTGFNIVNEMNHETSRIKLENFSTKTLPSRQFNKDTMRFLRP